MAIQWGDTGRASVGAQKTFNFSYTVREDNSTLNAGVGTFSTNLPTVQTPASAKAVFTVQQSDLPVITPNAPCIYTALITISGQNTTAGAINVLYSSYVNGSSTVTNQSNAVAANNFYCDTIWRFVGVKVGDVLEVDVWAAAAGVTFDYVSMYILPSQVQLTKKGTVMKDFQLITDSSIAMTQTPSAGGTFTPSSLTQLQIFLNNSLSMSVTSSLTGPGMTFAPYYNYVYKVYDGDSNQGQNQQNSATLRTWQRQCTPSQITFREVAY